MKREMKNIEYLSFIDLLLNLACGLQPRQV